MLRQLGKRSDKLQKTWNHKKNEEPNTYLFDQTLSSTLPLNCSSTANEAKMKMCPFRNIGNGCPPFMNLKHKLLLSRQCQKKPPQNQKRLSFLNRTQPSGQPEGTSYLPPLVAAASGHLWFLTPALPWPGEPAPWAAVAAIAAEVCPYLPHSSSFSPQAHIKIKQQQTKISPALLMMQK